MNKDTKNIYPIHPLLQKRWSPRAFLSNPVEPEKLKSVFEAARWSPSGGNQQPWRFILGFKDDLTYRKIFNTLAQGNQDWVFRAPVLVLAIGRTVLNTDDSIPNSSYSYDVGQAVAHLSFQATQEGLFVHQMSGFDKNAAKEAFDIPFPFEPLTTFVIGYGAEPEILENPVLIRREKEARIRNNFDEFIFTEKFGNPAHLSDPS